MAVAASLACTEEMMDESPDVTTELKERKRYLGKLNPNLTFNQEVTAFTDTKLLHDERILPGMLDLEKVLVDPTQDYFHTVQRDLTPEMKRMVALWMFEVCEEEKLHESVFLRAVQYMDRFLSLQGIIRAQLQLLGAVCVLVSSKINGTTISPKRLVSYTAHSVTVDMILQWEQLLLGILKWDIYGIVTTDFVQHILCLLPRELWDNRAVSERIKTFTAYCAVDHQLGVHLPSMIAAATITAAMTPVLGPEKMKKVLSTIQSATNVDLEQLRACVDEITGKVRMTVAEERNATDASNGEDKTPSKSTTVTCPIKAR